MTEKIEVRYIDMSGRPGSSSGSSVGRSSGSSSGLYSGSGAGSSAGSSSGSSSGSSGGSSDSSSEGTRGTNGLYYHKYIVYTDSEGNEHAARAGSKPSWTGFGELVTEHGVFTDAFTDFPKDEPTGYVDPSETIIEGEDLSSYWQSIKDAMDDIGDEGHNYSPTGKNSNAAVDEALDRAGLPSPQSDDFNETGEYWSPTFVDELPEGVDPNYDNLLFDKPQWFQDFLNDWGFAKLNNSPLVLDLDGQGIDLASVIGSDGVYWDIDQDGFAEKSGWISGNDGLLAIDLNADGIINDHGELFGTDTIDGFTILSAYDSNTDNVIDVNDAQFADLLVWVDANSDGYSQSGELFSLTDLNITSINLNASLVDYDIAGNHVTHESTFIINGQTQTIVDAWFEYDNANSHYQETYTLDFRTMYLPTLRGFGDVKDLHIAMSMDETLLLLVQEIAVANVDTILFDPAFDLLGKIETIMLRWAGVDGVDPASRGTVNAQKLGFLEAYFGDNYVNPNNGTSMIPIGIGVDKVHNLFDDVTAKITFSIIAQTGAAYYLGDGVSYNFVTGQVDGIDNVKALSFLSNSYVRSTENSDVYVFADNSESVVIHEGVIDGYDQIWVGYDSTDVRSWVDLGGEWHIRLGETSSSELTVNGLSNWTNGVDIVDRIDTVTFSDGVVWDLSQGLKNIIDTNDAHTLWGSALDDEMDGRGGNDTIHGWAGNDILIGGAGDDSINGGDGDDSFVWSVGDGNDTINDTGGLDQLVLHGVLASEVRIEKYGLYALKVHVESETIIVNKQFMSDYAQNNSYDQYQVESILLDDDSTIDLLNNITFVGTSANDSISGLNAATIFIGEAGNDTLSGKTNDDSFVWSVGDGNDTINDTGGIDQLVLHGVLASEVRIEKYSLYTLKVHVGSETIIVNRQFMSDYAQNDSYDQYQVENILLDDGSTIDLLNNLEFTGTAGNETINGLSADDILFGLDGVDSLRGNSGNDILYGDGGSDYLYGGSGEDVLYGGAGVDMLYGQAGADTFVFDDTVSSDNIQDFNLSEGDKLDISDLLIGYDPLTDAISDFVEITESGSNSYLSVDADGGANNFVQVAYIYNETGLTDEDALEVSGNLIAA